MTQVTTHVLDTAQGAPMPGVPVTLYLAPAGAHPAVVGRATTDADGRIGAGGFAPVQGPCRCRLVFTTSTPFFPEISVTFDVAAGREHLHVPLLLSPFGYSVYRGS